MTEELQPLTKKTLERIRALAKGNGLAAERITVLESNESIYKIPGLLLIEPHFDVQSRTVTGRIKGKNVRLFPSFEAMEQEIESQRQAYSEGGDWLEHALEEIQKAPSRGWGEEGTEVTWGAAASLMAATENCPTCRGAGTSPCPYCQGLGFKTCPYCEGRGKELCPHCAGTGQDPAQPGQPCYVCRGERYAECRYCHLSGKLNCERCHGKATLPCADCKGTGFMTREAKITNKATLRFSLGETRELPSGLLRMVQRAGLDKLGRGLADIEMIAPGEDSELPPSARLMTATLPYAEIKMKIGSKQGKIAAFGKPGRLSGVPPFLDDVLQSARALLVKAAKGEIVLEKVTGLRVMKDALTLSLAGQTHPNALRRHYPVGLSEEAARDIMKHMGLALRAQTKQVRQMIGWGYAALCGFVFAALMLTPLFSTLTAGRGLVAALSVQLLLLAAALGGGWGVLSNAARWALVQKYPGAKIGKIQEIGRTGYYVFGAILALYALILGTSGQLALFLR